VENKHSLTPGASTKAFMRLEKLWDNGKSNLSFCKAAFHMKGRHHLVCICTRCSCQWERKITKKKKEHSNRFFQFLLKHRPER